LALKNSARLIDFSLAATCPMFFNCDLKHATLRRVRTSVAINQQGSILRDSLRLSAIGLSLHLLESFVSKHSQGERSKERERGYSALAPSPLVVGWSFTLFGFIVGCYCWWEANVRFYRLWWLWLLGLVAGLLMFAYGFSVLVDRSLESL